MNAVVARWLRLRDWLESEAGGPPVVKLAWVIDAQKGATLPYVLALMAHYGNDTPTAWVYAGLHGSYGLCWLLKDLVFPDPSWQRRVPVVGAMAAWALVLGPYWIAPWLIVSRRVEAPPWLLGAAVVVYALGLVLMMGSDAQKHFVLRERPGLVTTGFFARVRHPNYLGEMLLYGAFAALARHPVPWLVLAWVWLGVFVPNMLRKEARMARHAEWTDYVSRTGFLLPKLGAASPRVRPARD